MRSYIIHMSTTVGRAENVARLLKQLPQAEVVEAVDGSDPAQTKGVALEPGTLHHPPYPFRLNSGEIGCFLSHRRCWEKIAQGDEPFGLIAEDDLGIDPAQFSEALNLINRYADEDSLIRLPSKTREKPLGAIARQGPAALFLPRTIGLQAVCLVVGRAAARRLLEASTTIDRPVDTTIQMHWVTGQPVHTIQPNGIFVVKFPSTIQHKTRTSNVPMREILRARYRAKIRRIPQTA
ncbi:Glycosyl transferase, family 25 [Sulfitobacter noctilucicola]|uniref:GR25 family glycosyltransferase involved in LPS biosynthesis n=1 Tax=Sulfitobacter noctilucicola TaxID=1342301 RepID=A0A7W6Q2R3_9RHOB|nr:glycosyltransferase family 25 protein [Sulfitobacter noctilucicola]KIN63160.1 Glycosyl transferase, family 25 [Sulfitobacter noctilucicola]MBB4172314.1 GR25 family glycosyltransferase involved in LPS biosynthesis [Sulfitobacter noctilucicola]